MKKKNPYDFLTLNSVQDWILDSITEFLKSPVWKNPILEFIDEHCIVFDEEDENKLEYTAIHNVFITLYLNYIQKFKLVVDKKLEKFVAELGIGFDVFVTACEVAS